MKYKRLNEIFNHWNTTFGFFQALYAYLGLHTETDPVPEWLENAAVSLDFVYHANVSGEKPISRLVENFVENDEISLTNAIMVAGMFWTLHGANLQKEYNVLALQYRPNANYFMESDGSVDIDSTVDNSKYGTKTDQKSGVESRTKAGKEHHKKSGDEWIERDGSVKTTTDTDDKIYGFDSAVGVNSDSTETVVVQSFGKTKTGNDPYIEKRKYNPDGTPLTDTKEFENYSETLQYGDNNSPITETHIQGTEQFPLKDVTDTDSTEETHEEKEGNTGIYSQQNLLNQEIELWKWNFYYNYLFPCVDMVLTLPIY